MSGAMVPKSSSFPDLGDSDGRLRGNDGNGNHPQNNRAAASLAPRRRDEDEGQGWELQRLSWARAIGVFWVYAGWLILDLVALAVALTAVVTDHWIVPTGSALPFVSHAGLWKVCFTAAATQADGRELSSVDTFADIDDWWTAVSDSYLDVPDTRAYLQVGCTRTVAELYAHVWGEDRLVWLQICRSFAVLYLWCGFLKVVTVTRNYSEASAGRWLSSGLAVFLACAQLCFGEVAWFLFLAILRRAMSDAPAFLDRGTFENYEGWSFWAFFAAVQFTALCTSLYLFVEVATGCVGDRKRRFERFDWRGGRRGETYHKM